MQLIWFGHSCFLIKTDEGKRILMDPFNNYLGYNSNFPKCDLITISHNHFDHSYINEINAETKILNTCDILNLDYVHIEGLNSFHDDYNGLKRGRNIIYIFKFKNISLAHLGDLGNIPDDSVLNHLSSLDFLLIPIGGNFTIDGNTASKLCKLLQPHYIIPMHYKTNLTSINLNGSKKFLISMNNIQKINSNQINLSDWNLNTNNMNVLLLTPPISF